MIMFTNGQESELLKYNGGKVLSAYSESPPLYQILRQNKDHTKPLGTNKPLWISSVKINKQSTAEIHIPEKILKEIHAS